MPRTQRCRRGESVLGISLQSNISFSGKESVRILNSRSCTYLWNFFMAKVIPSISRSNCEYCLPLVSVFQTHNILFPTFHSQHLIRLRQRHPDRRRSLLLYQHSDQKDGELWISDSFLFVVELFLLLHWELPDHTLFNYLYNWGNIADRGEMWR